MAENGFCCFEVYCESTDGQHGTAVCVEVLYMLPVTIIHNEVIYIKHIQTDREIARNEQADGWIERQASLVNGSPSNYTPT
jgi:hypothetical protein